MQLAVLYSILALIATAANIATQDVVVRAWPAGHAVAVSVAAGTAVGPVVKYALDKRYIFAFRARNAAHDGATFALYTAMGVVTTAIFWGTEWLFHTLFGTATLRYVGAACGLAIGYWAKYHLDKRYVFATERACA